MKSGQPEEAGKVFLTLFVDGRKRDDGHAVRRSFLLSEMVSLASKKPAYYQRLLDLVRELEVEIIDETADHVVIADWSALVEELFEAPNSYRLSVFDTIKQGDFKQLVQFLIWEDLAMDGRWESIEKIVVAMASTAKSDAESIVLSAEAQSITAEARAKWFLKTYRVVLEGLVRLEHSDSAKEIRNLISIIEELAPKTAIELYIEKNCKSSC